MIFGSGELGDQVFGDINISMTGLVEIQQGFGGGLGSLTVEV